MSRMAAKMLGESKCGRQHQSMDPSVPTSTAVCKSPMIPYSSMRLYFTLKNPPKSLPDMAERNDQA